MVDACI